MTMTINVDAGDNKPTSTGDMTVETARQLRAAIEKGIAEAIIIFEQRTGMHVDAINLRRHGTYDVLVGVNVCAELR